jgi:hypothetical protein
MWPAFAACVVLDGVIGHALPPSGETQTVLAAAVSGCLLSLIGVIVLTRPLGALIRRLRGDLPVVVARNYAGTGVVLAVAVALASAGVLHHSSVMEHQRAMRDAIVRAQAWIGSRAPAEFRRNIQSVSTVVIEAGRIYRTCVPSDVSGRTYCVVVNTSLPLAKSVSFAGYEPNSVFAQGTG